METPGWKNILGIYSQTSLSKGLRFYQHQGKWVIINQEIKNNYLYPVFHCHWFYILYKDDDKSMHEKIHNGNYLYNAVVFREGEQIILEITNNINDGVLIEAVFYNIAEEELIHITEIPTTHSLKQFEDNVSPLDLSNSKHVNTATCTKRTKPKRQMLPCEVCTKEFDRPSLLKRHIRTHTGERPHVCDVCTKGFSTSSSLNTHRRIHSGERPHQCLICGKKFTASSNLYYHRMTHSAEKPYKCDICFKSFPTPGNLRSHRYSHEGLSPFRCPMCSRTFAKQTNLRNHMQQHACVL